MKVASIHGRFQPFHNGHMKYAMAAMDLCDQLYIGLTKVLPDELFHGKEHAPHRDLIDSNPFSYRERQEIIDEAMKSAGVNAEQYRIGPFPIEDLRRLPEFWPLDSVCYTTIVDDWNLTKIDLLKKSGYQVGIVRDTPWTGKNFASGTQMRKLIRNDDKVWKLYVPLGAEKVISNITAQRKI